jgi:hypothetical protein
MLQAKMKPVVQMASNVPKSSTSLLQQAHNVVVQDFCCTGSIGPLSQPPVYNNPPLDPLYVLSPSGWYTTALI